jgi:hypothetical protein
MIAKAVGAVTSCFPCFSMPHQPIDATHALNRSAGVSNPSVFSGCSFSCRGADNTSINCQFILDEMFKNVGNLKL